MALAKFRAATQNLVMKRMIALLAASLLASPARAEPPMPPEFAALAAKLLPSVVSVASTDPVTDNSSATPDDGGNDDNGGADGSADKPAKTPNPIRADEISGSVLPPPKAEEALGSGFVIDPAGYIVTNNHVIDGASSVSVTFQDGTILPATVVGRDRRGDLAVLKVNAGYLLPAVKFGDSSKLRVGDWVLAIGNPYGLAGSTSAGIVSALHRNIGEDKYDDFIQTDATINRGNSGGPLFDVNGDVIGVDSAIYSPSGGSVGIGFAIPSAMVQPIAESLKTTGDIKRGWLGVSTQEVTPQIQQLLGLPGTQGALIGGVSAGGPADGKLRPGDVLVSLNGVAITDPRSLFIRTAEIPSGQTATAQFWRAGAMQSAAMTIAVPPPDEKPGTAPAAPAAPAENIGAIGMAVAATADASGAQVLSVTHGGPAAKAGVVADDVVQAVGAAPISTPDDLTAAVKSLRDARQPVAALLISGDDAAGNDDGPRWVAMTMQAGSH
jgi:serine protease Do/2-alkenal reductase